MSKHKTYHLFIIDKSSSMSGVRDVTISGMNEQLDSIRKSQEDFDNQEQIGCLVLFSNSVDLTDIWNKPIKEIENFNEDTYVPNGMTALHEAIGRGISKLKNEITQELSDRTANVIVNIFTDGQENASSHEWKGTPAREIVEEVKETGLWTVAFIGCGENVFNVAQSLGISQGDTMSYQPGSVGTQTAFTKMATSRGLRSQCYSEAIADGLDTKQVNLGCNFFENMDISAPIVGGDVSNIKEDENIQTDGTNSAVDLT
ncbi:MAG: VWA domain-containing protein [Clostridiales bacterium]|nr:VWA domain-containing protein [Clostridiales bacterium]